MRSLLDDVNNNKFYLDMNRMFETNEIPNNIHDYYTTDKIDDSLITPIVINDKIHLRSRNTFFSGQSKYASFLLNDKYEA